LSTFLKCKCPHCAIEIEFASEDAGRSCNCPSCGNALQLPIPSANLINETKPAASPPPQIVYAPPQTIYVKEKPKTGCLTQIIAVFLIGGLIIFIISLVNTSNSPSSISSPSISEKKTVNADISYNDYKVTIKNLDSFDWPELDVYINGSPPFSYTARIQALKSGESATYDLNQFAKSDGERFNPDAYKVTELWIGGDDYDYKKYGP
jgi:hypothetical protein